MSKNQDESNEVPQQAVPRKITLWRGIKGTCPRCGQGKLFNRYLVQVENCGSCQEDIASLRADDGPAWLTILLIGHLIAPFISFFALNETYPAWLMLTMLLTLIFVLVLLLLPRSKGLFISALWLIKQKKT